MTNGEPTLPLPQRLASFARRCRRLAARTGQAALLWLVAEVGLFWIITIIIWLLGYRESGLGLVRAAMPR